MQDILKQYVYITSLIFFLSIIISVAAQEQGNETGYETSQTNETSTDFTEGNQTNTTETLSNLEGNESAEGIGETEQETTFFDEINGTESTETTNQTNSTSTPEERMLDITDFIITLTPTEVKQGDVILTITIENNGTVALQNLIPLISGKGFSVYDVVSIKEVAPAETASAYVLGHFSDAGTIALTIKMNEKTETQTVVVSGTSENEEEREAAKKEALKTLSTQIEQLEEDFAVLENTLEEKQEKYVLNDVDLNVLKEYIRTAHSHVLAGKVEEANISIILAQTEYEDLKNKVDTAKKKSLWDILKDNVLLISTLAGAILTLFAFIEFVRKKQAGIYQKIKEFKVDQNTRIEVHKKKETTDKKEAKKEKNEEKKKKDTDDSPKLDVWELEL